MQGFCAPEWLIDCATPFIGSRCDNTLCSGCRGRPRKTGEIRFMIAHPS